MALRLAFVTAAAVLSVGAEDTAGVQQMHPCAHTRTSVLWHKAQEGVIEKIGAMGFPTSLSSTTSAVQKSQQLQAAQRRQTHCVETAGSSHSLVRSGDKILLTCIYSTASNG